MDGQGISWQLSVWWDPCRLQVFLYLCHNSSQFLTVILFTRYIVTAAHCLFFDEAAPQPMAPSNVKVTLGEHDR